MREPTDSFTDLLWLAPNNQFETDAVNRAAQPERSIHGSTLLPHHIALNRHQNRQLKCYPNACGMSGVTCQMVPGYFSLAALAPLVEALLALSRIPRGQLDGRVDHALNRVNGGVVVF